MKALSVRQPWAWLIASGNKDIENRTWGTKSRGRIYIHAGLRVGWDRHFPDPLQEFRFIKERLPDIHFPIEIYHGGIIGEVDIVDCVTKSDSPWFIGPYGFVLANPVAYDKPIPCKGWLGLFDVPDSLIAGSELRLESDRALL